MDISSDEHTGIAPPTIEQAPGSGIAMALPPQRKHKTKRAREVATQDGEAASEERRMKKKRRSSDGTALTVESGIDYSSVVSAAGAVVKEKKKEKQKSKKRKATVAPCEESGVTNNGLDFASMMSDSVNAADSESTVAGLHLGSSERDSMPPINSNDDILRAFQSLDFSRLAGVLRNLELPSAGVDLNTGDSPFAALLDPNPPTDDQITSTGTDTRAHPVAFTHVPVSTPAAPPRKTKRVAMAQQHPKPSSSTPKTTPTIPAVGPSVANLEHAEMLATKWLSTAKLKELVETEGLVYKKGKFSVIEQQALKTAVENYRVNCGLSHEQLLEVIFSKSKESHGSFWSEITASVPERPLMAVYHHIHRAYDPMGLQGKWTKEEDEALISAVTDLGQAWQKVKDRVGRPAQDCRDRWRNHLANRSERQRGPWSQEEEEELIRIVLELTTEQGKSADNDIFWGIVSQRMGHKRGRQQCRMKWTDSLNKRVKSGGENPKWRMEDTYILLHKLTSLHVRDDSEIDWKILGDEDWNLWSAHVIQRQWRRLTKTVKGYEEMTFQEIVQILKQECTHPDASRRLVPKRPRRRSKSPKKPPKSAPIIEDDKWDDERWESEEQS